MKALAEALRVALEPARGGRVRWIGLAPIEDLGAIGAPDEPADAVVLAPGDEALAAAALAARGAVRAGGVLAVVLPIEREGVRSVTQRALAAFDPKKRPRPLEDACAALLAAGVSPVKVIEVKGPRGEAVVHGTAIDDRA